MRMMLLVGSHQAAPSGVRNTWSRGPDLASEHAFVDLAQPS